MASHAHFLLLLLLLLLLINLASYHVSAERVVEDGYTVTTLIDGHKLKINPHAVLLQPGSSDLIVLDSSNNAFYSLSFPISQESVVKKRLSGNGDGVVGYSDGESGTARFKNPRSFAVDVKGNVYVADKKNHAIRKISKSGVSTIAGGKETGQQDGPGWNATFSNDFELVFVPEQCALLVSDHGTQLVRRIDLKAEDCVRGSHSVLGAVSVWVLGLGLSCLFGLIVGLVVRPYIIPRERVSPLCFAETWKHYLINLGKQVPSLCFDIRGVVASSTHYALLRRLFCLSQSHLSLLFKMNNVESRNSYKDVISMLDADDSSSCDISKSQMFADQLKDLMSFDGSLELPDTANEIFKRGDGDQERSDVLSDCHGKIDDMILANIMGFAKAAKETTPLNGPLVVSSGLVKRR